MSGDRQYLVGNDATFIYNIEASNSIIDPNSELIVPPKRATSYFKLNTIYIIPKTINTTHHLKETKY